MAEMVEMPKVFAFDLDGTLVNEARELSERMRKVLETLHDHGARIGIASGRPCESLNKLPAKWGLSFSFDFTIGMNGAELYDTETGEFCTFDLLSREDLREIVINMRRFDGNGIIYEGEQGVMQRTDELVEASARRNGILNRFVPEEYLYAEPRAKIMYRFPEDRITEILNWFLAHPSERYTCFLTQPTVMEFAPRRTEKVNALRMYCDSHGIPMTEVLAAGDTSNDCGILRECGYSVCMINGTADAKAAAKEITKEDNDHDGLALYIEERILQEGVINNEISCG